MAFNSNRFKKHASPSPDQSPRMASVPEATEGPQDPQAYAGPETQITSESSHSTEKPSGKSVGRRKNNPHNNFVKKHR
jgi:hypothetical protein